MTRDELLARLKGYEWTDFECKKAQRDVPNDAYKTVSAFANTEGGWLLFGVSDKEGVLTVSGVDPDAFDRVQNDFLSTLRAGDKFNHVITVDPHVYDLDGKRILAFYVPESPRHQKPVYLKGNPRDSFIRRAAGDERVTDTELQRFLRDAATRTWDTEPLPEFDVQRCLDTETVKWYQSHFYRRNPEQRLIEDPIEFLQEWNFIVEPAGQPLLTRAAVLLFAVDRCVRQLLPRPVLDYQRIDTSFDAWSAVERWHDRLVFEENLFKTWRGLVAKYMRIAEHPFSIDPATLRRNDDPPDYIAFREAAINLLIHQDYGDLNRKAALKIFTDRTQLWNPGDAFANRDQLLQATEKEVRNPLVVNAFRRIGLSDQAGTGIRAIFRNWSELGRVPPQIDNDKAGKSFALLLLNKPLVTDAMRRFQMNLGVRLSPEQAALLALAAQQNHFSLIDASALTDGNLRRAHEAVKYLVHQQLLQTLDENATFALTEMVKIRLVAQTQPPSTGQVPSKYPASTQQVTQQVAKQVTQQVRSLLESTVGEHSRAELMQALGLSDRVNFSQLYLEPALAGGFIEMTQPESPRSPTQKYRLTEQGKTFLESIQ